MEEVKRCYGEKASKLAHFGSGEKHVSCGKKVSNSAHVTSVMGIRQAKFLHFNRGEKLRKFAHFGCGKVMITFAHLWGEGEQF